MFSFPFLKKNSTQECGNHITHIFGLLETKQIGELFESGTEELKQMQIQLSNHLVQLVQQRDRFKTVYQSFMSSFASNQQTSSSNFDPYSNKRQK